MEQPSRHTIHQETDEKLRETKKKMRKVREDLESGVREQVGGVWFHQDEFERHGNVDRLSNQNKKLNQ